MANPDGKSSSSTWSSRLYASLTTVGENPVDVVKYFMDTDEQKILSGQYQIEKKKHVGEEISKLVTQ